MAWQVSAAQAGLYIETAKNRDAPDISKGAVIAVASEIPRPRGVSVDTDTHYLVCEAAEEPASTLAWVHQPDVKRSWLEAPKGTARASTPLGGADSATNWVPLRKIGVALVASGLTWIALRAGVDLGESEINEAATGIVGLLTAYLVPDPRVKPSGTSAELEKDPAPAVA